MHLSPCVDSSIVVQVALTGWEGIHMATEEERRAARAGLVSAAVRVGLPIEFAELLVHELRTTPAMQRMTAYLLGVRPTHMEDIADEMLAIMEQRDRWFEQKRSEEANATITAFYNRPDRPDEDN